MRVCMFTRAVIQQGKGGMEDHISMLCTGLAKAGVEIEVITTSHPQGLQEEEIAGVKYHYLPGSLPKKYSGAWWKNSAKKFLELHSKKPFDLVHAQSAGGFGFVSDPACRSLSLPVVTSLHGTTHDEVQTQLSKLKSIAQVRTLSDIADTLRAIPKIAVQLHSYFFIDAKYMAESGIIIATSNEQKKTLVEKFSIPEGKIEVIYNAMDENLFSPMPRHLAVQKTDILGSPVFLCVARLEREKGVQNAILALQSLLKDYPTALLVIVGDGSYRPQLESLAKDLKVHHNLKFTGFVDFQSLPLYFNACDIFLNPTVRQDGYDLTVLEAMSCEKPVVASNIGSMPTAVSHGQDGILVKPGSVPELVLAIKKLLEDRENARRLGQAARKKILFQFSQKSMVAGTVAAYKRAISQAKKK